MTEILLFKSAIEKFSELSKKKLSIGHVLTAASLRLDKGGKTMSNFLGYLLKFGNTEFPNKYLAQDLESTPFRRTD